MSFAEIFGDPEEMRQAQERREMAAEDFRARMVRAIRPDNGVDSLTDEQVVLMRDVMAGVANSSNPGEIANWYEGMFAAASILRADPELKIPLREPIPPTDAAE